MAVGHSGRIVVDLDPELKRRLHARLRSEGRDFKAWLLERVHEYLAADRGSEGGLMQDETARRTSERSTLQLGEREQRVLHAVSADPRAQHHVDDLAHATGLDVREIHEVLLQLELAGHVVQQFGFYRRARPS